MTGALSHLRVLDMSRVLAGPWVGQMFADLGADVIKIERPGRGDDTRSWGPPYLKDADGRDTSEPGYFLSANRNKRSVTIDITRPEGQELIRGLAALSDVLIENYKVGGLIRYDLDYEALRQINPGLVYCSITGFGQSGPSAQRPGYDFMIQAMSGLMSITGEKDTLPGGGPQKVGVAVADILTGLYAGNAIQAALLHRELTGRGQYIDLALLDCQLAAMANQAMNYLVSGKPPGRLGNAHPNIVPYQVFASRDGFLIIAVGNDDQYRRFCRLLDREDLADEPDFQTNRERVRNRERLVAILEPLVRVRASREWMQLLEEQNIPCGPIYTLDQTFSDPQTVSRQMRVEMDHALAGRVPLVGSPFKLSETPVEYRMPPPLLGEHTDEVLQDVLGLDQDAIGALRSERII